MTTPREQLKARLLEIMQVVHEESYLSCQPFDKGHLGVLITAALCSEDLSQAGVTKQLKESIQQGEEVPAVIDRLNQMAAVEDENERVARKQPQPAQPDIAAIHQARADGIRIAIKVVEQLDQPKETTNDPA